MIHPAAKDSVNPHFKSTYADLSSVWTACREALSKNGLSVVQNPAVDGDVVSVETWLLHTSGQFMVGTIAMRPMQMTLQGVGGAISYLRRYALAAIAGVTAEDLDGEPVKPALPVTPAPQAVAQQVAQVAPKKAKPPEVIPEGAITIAQVKRLFTIAHEAKWTDDQLRELIKDVANVESTRQLFPKDYDEICKYLSAGNTYEKWLGEKL